MERGLAIAFAGLALLVGAASARGGIPPNNEPYGRVVVFDPAKNVRLTQFPLLRNVLQIAADGRGGFYAVEGFSDPHPRSAQILHINRDGSRDRDFNIPMRAALRGGAQVTLVHAGGLLYVGGSFTSLGGSERDGLAAIDTTTKGVTAWNPRLSGGRVFSITPAAGNVIVQDDFGIKAFDARTAQLRWSHNLTIWGRGLEVLAHGELYVGGLAQPPYGIVRFDPAKGTISSWQVRATLAEQAGMAWATQLIAVGNTLAVGSQKGFCMSVDIATRRFRHVDAPCFSSAAALTGSTLYLGGTTETNTGFGNIRAFDVRMHRYLRFHPRLIKYQLIDSLAMSGSHLIVLGDFLKSLG